MDGICRLCCSSKFVNNNIFDDEGAIYVKIALYLPIEVFKNDRLPQKICDKCSCKVNDFYQFCNEAIEVQNRLRKSLKSLVLPEGMIDLTLKKEHCHSPEPPVKPSTLTVFQDQWTQTDVEPTEPTYKSNIDIKQEPVVKSPQLELVKEEVNLPYEGSNDDDFSVGEIPSDDSDLSLNTLKKKKNNETMKLKKVKMRGLDLLNGDGTENKKERKRKRKLKDLDSLVNGELPTRTAIVALLDKAGDVDSVDDKLQVKLDIVKRETDGEDTVEESLLEQWGLAHLKQEGGEAGEAGDWRCCVCFTRTCLRSEMLQHYRSHAAEVDRALEDRPESPVVVDGGYIKCTHCTKMFNERGGWQRHVWRHQRRPYRCALCEKTFREPSHILKHGQTHSFSEGAQPLSKRFVCDLCPEEFVYMRYLLEHRAHAHPEARGRTLVHRCVQCGRQFAHLNSLRRHLRSHSGERNYLCNVCGKALSSREHLKFHIRIHTGYKPNVCKTCGKGFVKKCNLTLHERVHSGEKPHVCSHCGKAFSQRSTLVIHERYHSGLRPYVCSLCGRGFVAKGLLSMHLKTTCI